MKSRSRLSASLLLGSLVVALLVPIVAVSAARAPLVTSFAGRSVDTRASSAPTSLTARAPRPVTAPALGLGTPTAEFQVDYNNFSPNAEAAFQAAVDVWETLVVSDCVIHVNATWTPLPAGVLGSAGPAGFFLGADNYVYPAALYEAATSDCGQTSVEINASFSSAFDSWYLGTDGNTPFNKWDFFSVVMHEIGHGMGVMSSFRVSGGLGYWGFTNGSNAYKLRYDSYEWTAATAGSKMTSFSPFGTTKLKNQLTDGSVFFGGPEVVAALGSRLRLFAPSPWQGGSSNSHLDEATYGPGNAEALMTPSISNGEVIHGLGPVTLGLLRDIGWETSDGGPPPTAPDNDNFADVVAVTPTTSVTATTDEATLEVGEPVPSCSPSAGKTVWYRFTPAASRKFSASTAGSDFDTFIAVYTGADLASLVQLKCNDNATGVQTSKFGVQLQAGTTYYFQVGGATGDGGSLTFRVKKA